MAGSAGLIGKAGGAGDMGRFGRDGRDGQDGQNVQNPGGGTNGTSGGAGGGGGNGNPGANGGVGGGAMELNAPMVGGRICLSGTVLANGSAGSAPGGGGGAGGSILLIAGTIDADGATISASGGAGSGGGGGAGKIVFSGTTVSTTGAILSAVSGASGGSAGGAAGLGGAAGAAGVRGVGGQGGTTAGGNGGAGGFGGSGGVGGKLGRGGAGGPGGKGGKPGDCPRWCDRICVTGGPDGATYTATPGIWTKDGEEIGRTFRNGATVTAPPGQTVYRSDYIRLPAEPNDFHYIGDTYTTPSGTTTISCWSFWNPFFSITIQVTMFKPITPGDHTTDCIYDFNGDPSDPFFLLFADGVVLYSGPFSLFNPVAFNVEPVTMHILDNTQLVDCNNNGQPDGIDIQNDPAIDCNYNGLPDSCDIASGYSADVNGNLLPDECDGAAGFQCNTCYGDANGDTVVNLADVDPFVEELLADEGYEECSDANVNGDVNGRDIQDFIELALAETHCAGVQECAPTTARCDSPHAGPGCNDPALCESVCDVEPYCCDANGHWDGYCAVMADLLGPPRGDHPGAAIPMSNGVFAGTTTNNLISPHTPGCAGPTPTPGEWWQYTASCSGTLTVSTCGDTFFNTVLAVYLPGGPPIEIGCNDNSAACGPAATNGGFQSQLSVPVVAGQNYLILVTGNDGDTGSYTLNVSCTAGPSCTPDFNVIAPGVFNGSTVGAGDDCSLRPTPDRIYSVNFPAPGPWMIILCGGTNFNSMIFAGSTCCSSNLGMNDDGCGPVGGPSQMLLNIPVPGQYFITIEGAPPLVNGNYQMQIFQPG